MWQRIKKIDKLIINSFWMPYVVSFFVAEFVLVMQFMWKYIDEILGKGFPLLTLFELIFYYAVQLIPQAIPLTILISSIMQMPMIIMVMSNQGRVDDIPHDFFNWLMRGV